MSKRKEIQLIFEYFVDFMALLAASAVAFVISAAINKMPEIDVDSVLAYCFISFISFSVVFLGFSSSINLEKRSRTAEFISVLRNCLLTYMTVAVFMVLTKNELLQSRYFFVISLFLYICLSSAGRYILKRILIMKFSESKMASLVGVITSSDRAETFLQSLSEDWGRKITGIALIDAVYEDGVYKYHHPEESIDENGNTKVTLSYDLETVREIAGVPVMANGANFMKWVRNSSLDEIFINTPVGLAISTNDYIKELESMGVTVHVNIPVSEEIVNSPGFGKMECSMYAGYPMASFTAKSISTTGAMAKRIFDFIFGLIGTILSAPIIALTAIPLLIESKGPLIFKQQRVGKNGRIFNIYKLRSMYADAEERKKELEKSNKMNGLMFKMDEDPRITKVGKFIRKTSIDELPQFWNILKGDMSLIGTRPPTLDEFEKYESHHKRRLSMKPGITGMWQVSGRSNIHDFEEIVKLDCEYIDNWSPWLDIKIFFKTIKVVLKGIGAE